MPHGSSIGENMSRNPLLDLAQYQNPNMTGQMAAIALKARENRMANGLGVNQAQPQQPQKPTPPPDPKAKFKNELNRMFTPYENGGALITSRTPSDALGMATLPDGYGWNDIPKAMRDKMKLPDGVVAIGFHPGRMTPTQHQAMDWFGQQRDAERQKEADAMQQQALASNPQSNQ